MDSAHQPILNLALGTLPEVGGTVIDLGCGNGALLQKLWTANINIVPSGIELEGDRFAHIVTLLPQFTENFVLGSLFSENQWQNNQRYI